MMDPVSERTTAFAGALPLGPAPRPRPAVWGGVECTVNRVADTYNNQLDRSGHAVRAEDLVRFAELGIAAIRYPVLWERTAPDGIARADWRWPDERLALLRDLAIEPVVGLLHHGSGPPHTSLLDPAFPAKLAAYAGAVARRYPHLELYTPVNEPLTTARFSALYGVWFPHMRSAPAFCSALLNQCKGIVLSMAAIREVNPRAQLVQTEDLGKFHGTAPLQYQVAFNNEMRWLAWDLLCGRVDFRHPLWAWLTGNGVRPADLLWFREHPCVPDLLGANYYVTSERMLDHELARYPPALHGGNGRDRYVDVEAARSPDCGNIDLGRLLEEAWQRYRLPLAITEAHIDSTRDDQMRWLYELWNYANTACRRGIEVRAVTAWALLGSFDWNSLVTRDNGYYEPGAFDLRSPRPRRTAIGRMVRQLAAGEVPDDPVLQTPGWWRRPGRFLVRPAQCPPHGTSSTGNGASSRAPPILVTGATGTLGQAIARICGDRGLECRLLTRREMDIAIPESVEGALDAHRPWAIVNAAGYGKVDGAEADATQCFRENMVGAGVIAEACARRRLRLVTFSSDLVFDGTQTVPYVESDPPRPLNVFGKSKAAAEQAVLARHPDALVVRTSCLFGPWDAANEVTRALKALREGRTWAACSDWVVTPTYIPDLAHACLDLLLDAESGVVHLTHEEPTTWADLVARAAEVARLDASALQRCSRTDTWMPACRPAFSALGSRRCSVLPSLDSAVERYVAHCLSFGHHGRQ